MPDTIERHLLRKSPFLNGRNMGVCGVSNKDHSQTRTAQSFQEGSKHLITETELHRLTGFKPSNSHFVVVDGKWATFACDYTLKEFGHAYSISGIWLDEFGHKAYSHNCWTWCSEAKRHQPDQIIGKMTGLA